MKQPHKHAELIKAWADGAEIQFSFNGHDFMDIEGTPSWNEPIKYRIKPEPMPDIVTHDFVQLEGNEAYLSERSFNLKLTWCGETGKLKSAEVI